MQRGSALRWPFFISVNEIKDTHIMGEKPLIITRRGLRRADAALYVGLGPTKFDKLVKEGRMPKPVRIDGCVIWDVKLLDTKFDELSEPRNDWDE
jgi:predicted DNA-binding transcriptional regulator AlpA